MLLNQYVFNDFENILCFNLLSVAFEILYNDTLFKAFCKYCQSLDDFFSFSTCSGRMKTLKTTGVLAKSAVSVLTTILSSYLLDQNMGVEAQNLYFK